MENNKMELNKQLKELSEKLSSWESSLKQLTDACRQALSDSDHDYWHTLLGEFVIYPKEVKYDWVLVKLMDDMRFLPKRPSPIRYYTPHIAEYRSDGKWWSQELDIPYETPELPFKVISWRPIPGDCYMEFKNSEGVVIKGSGVHIF